MVRFGFSCSGGFAAAQTRHCTLASSTSQKFSLITLFILFGGGEKFIKGVFAFFKGG